MGEKIDLLFCDVIELLLEAVQSQKELKLKIVDKACVRLDMLKYFLQIAWNLKTMDNKKYLIISNALNEVGKMLGGWKKQVQNITLK